MKKLLLTVVAVLGVMATIPASTAHADDDCLAYWTQRYMDQYQCASTGTFDDYITCTRVAAEDADIVCGRSKDN